MLTRIVLACLVLTGCSPSEYIGLTVFKMDTSCNLCIVEGEINGKKTYFLVDTGAGLTTFDTNQSKYFGFSSVETDQEIGSFSNERSKIQEAVGIRSIKINGLEVTGGINYATNMYNLVNHVQQCSNKTISGIIGVPIIKRFNLVIDVPNGRLLKVN